MDWSIRSIQESRKKIWQYGKGTMSDRNTNHTGFSRSTQYTWGSVYFGSRPETIQKWSRYVIIFSKHTWPDLSNSNHELSKVMDRAMEGHMKELCRVIKYAIDTKDKGLKLWPEETDNKWKLKAYSDADFTGDKETQISVTGYIIYFMNVPIFWRSRGQKGVTLSTTEAEYVACSEVVKEIFFYCTYWGIWRLKSNCLFV